MNHDGTATVYYSEQDVPIGTRRAYCCGYSERSALWPNIAYFCPTCGSLWARAIYCFEFDYSPRVQLPWVCETRRCARCGDGTLLSGYGDEHLSECSPDLLTRELLILLERYPS